MNESAMMRDAAGHGILWSAFTLFFLLYGQLFCAIEQSRIRLNEGSYRWSGFGCEKWTNVREFQDYSFLASLVFRNERLADHLHTKLSVGGASLLENWILEGDEQGNIPENAFVFLSIVFGLIFFGAKL